MNSAVGCELSSCFQFVTGLKHSCSTVEESYHFFCIHSLFFKDFCLLTYQGAPLISSNLS